MFIFFTLLLLEVVSADLIIQTSNGLVQGVPSLVSDVEAFLGIPYAKPPVGTLRFAKPVPKERWHDVFQASSLPPSCMQPNYYPYYFMPNITNMSEDCLYLNIWAPKSKPKRGLRPAVIFFHPGSFISGSSNQREYDGSRIASRGDLVVVTVNYRLGSFGYFLGYTEEADGNMALYDQVMAIKWVKENAVRFSSDPDKIVLMGVSAGAFSVSALIVSPVSNNLFKRAIVESGSLLTPVMMKNDKLFENSQKVASLVGCSNNTVTLRNNPWFVVQCLKSKPTESIVAAEKDLLKTNPILFYPRANDEFLPMKFVDSLREGQFNKNIDLLSGITEEEGSMMLIVGMRDYLGNYGEEAHTMNKYRAVAFSRAASLAADVLNASQIIDVYLRSVKNRTPIEYTKMVANLIGDYSVACNTVFLADFLSLGGNSVYFYKFGYRAASTPMADWVGATHLDEIQYVFGNPYHKNFTPEETELSHHMIDHWSSFARTGNPNIPDHIEWPKYNYQKPLYLHFGQDEESIRLRPNDRCEFWRKSFDSEIDPELIQFLQSSESNTSKAGSLKNYLFLTLLVSSVSILFSNFFILQFVLAF